MRLRPVDIFAVICIVSVAALLIVVLNSRDRDYGQTECAYNLKVIFIDYLNFIDEHGDFQAVDGPLGTARQSNSAATYFRDLTSGEKPLHYLVCPLDQRATAAGSHELTTSNLSYFISVNAQYPANSQWILSGNRNISSSVGLGRSARTNGSFAWSPDEGLHGERGYLLFLDGSVTLVDSTVLNKLFNQGGNATNQIVLP